jgi:hypothetical protein
MPSRFEFLDTILKRRGSNSTLLLDYDWGMTSHVHMAKQMESAYGGELRRVCSATSGTMVDSFALGIYKVGGNSMIPYTDSNSYRAPKFSMADRRKSSKRGKKFTRNQPFASKKLRKRMHLRGDDDDTETNDDEQR